MDFKQFLVENWQIISSLLLTLISTILIILNKTKVISLPEGVVCTLIELINSAELKYGAGNGKLKLTYVLNEIKKYYPTISEPAVKNEVEIILSTPQRKGGQS